MEMGVGFLYSHFASVFAGQNSARTVASAHLPIQTTTHPIEASALQCQNVMIMKKVIGHWINAEFPETGQVGGP